MERAMDEKLKKIVKLYFDGYSVAEAIKEVNKKNPLQRAQINDYKNIIT